MINLLLTGFNEELKEEESGAVEQETDFSDNPYKLKKVASCFVV